jgi:hypothetical protein
VASAGPDAQSITTGEPPPGASTPLAAAQTAEAAEPRPEAAAITFKDLFVDDEVSAAAPRARRRGPLYAGLALALALLAAAWLGWRAYSPPPGAAPPMTGIETAPASPATEGVAAEPPPPAPAPEAGDSMPTESAGAASTSLPTAETPSSASGRVQLRLSREVWMRVVVDGRQVLARLVPGDQTLAFDPTQALIVRAGDAGAVEVIVDGESKGVLGREGAVVTRIFELPAPAPERP